MPRLLRLLHFAGIGIILLIWALSLMPLSNFVPPGGDKLHHFIAYGTLMLVWVLAKPRQTLWQRSAMALGFMAMGLAIEFAQGLTPYRFFEWTDARANALGVLLGWALGMWLQRLDFIRSRTAAAAD